MRRFLLRIVLFASYFLVVTPLGVVSKLLGRNTLQTDINRSQATYWVPKDIDSCSTDIYLRPD